jgi:hypothetical protein
VTPLQGNHWQHDLGGLADLDPLEGQVLATLRRLPSADDPILRGMPGRRPAAWGPTSLRQCDSIQGRLDGKLFAAPLRRNLEFDVEQHPQPAPCVSFRDDRARGALALRSFAAWARRDCDDMSRHCGAVSKTRGARARHSGQSDGKSYSDIGRILVNGPQLLHMYS